MYIKPYMCLRSIRCQLYYWYWHGWPSAAVHHSSLLNLWTFATQRRIPDLQVSPCVKKMDSRMRPWRTHFTTVAAVQTRHIKTQDTFTTFQDNQFLNGNLFLVCPKCDHRNEVHGIQHLEWSRHCGVLCRSVQDSAGMPHLPGKLPSWWKGTGTCSEVTPTWLWSMGSPNLNDHSQICLCLSWG